MNTKTKIATLVINKMEKFDSEKRSRKDGRKKVAWAVFSCVDLDTNYEYRKSFEVPLGTHERMFWDKIAPKIIKQKVQI